MERLRNTDGLQWDAGWVQKVWMPNVPDQRLRATDAEHGTETQSRGSVEPVCWAIERSCSFLSGSDGPPNQRPQNAGTPENVEPSSAELRKLFSRYRPATAQDRVAFEKRQDTKLEERAQNESRGSSEQHRES